MPNDTLEVTEKGIVAIRTADTTIAPLDVHVIMTLLGGSQTVLNIVETIQSVSKERKFIDPAIVARSIAKLERTKYIKINRVAPPVVSNRSKRRG